jgi:hypothetical protein
MPGRDRTGPLGSGPMTGRALGPCAGNTGPQSTQREIGGRRARRGGGRGWQRRASSLGPSDAVYGEGVDLRAGSVPGTASEPTSATVASPDLRELQEQLNQAVRALQELGERIGALEHGADA